MGLRTDRELNWVQRAESNLGPGFSDTLYINVNVVGKAVWLCRALIYEDGTVKACLCFGLRYLATGAAAARLTGLGQLSADLPFPPILW